MANIPLITPAYNRLRDIFSTTRENFASLTTPPEIGRRAVLPEWFYQAIYGQPRGVNITKIRELAQTPFIELCISTTIDEFATTDWKIVPKKDIRITPEVQFRIDELTQFLIKPNQNKETLSDLMRQWARDLLTVDAAVLVKVFSDDSYEGEYNPNLQKYEKKEEQITIQKNIYKTNTEELGKTKNVIKIFHPLKSKRKLTEIYCRDGSTFLPDADYTGFIYRYFQYSWRLPRREPLLFDRNEIVYTMKNPRSYSFFGWSPVQSLEAVVETLKMEVQYFEGIFKETGVPSGIISVLDISKIELDRLREYWRKEVKGKPHKLGVIGREAKFTPITITARDMEVLSTMQWFQKLVMASFSLNIPILSLQGTAPRAGTEALLKRERMKAVIPLMQLFTYEINAEVLSEFGYDDVEFRFHTYDPEEEMKELEIDVKKLDSGVITINEWRSQQGLELVPWGDIPFRGMPMFQQQSPIIEQKTYMPFLKSFKENAEKSIKEKK